MPITAEEILRGAYFAAEQAGNLLNDAYVLYRHRCWASSLMLSVFSLEELGKAELLLERAVEASKEGPADVEEVMERLRRHKTKIEAGLHSAGVSAPVPVFGDPTQFTREEWAELDKRLNEAKAIAVKNAPEAAHETRMRALYVDLGKYDWLRPAEITDEEAYLQLAQTAISYGIRRRKFTEPRDAFVAEVSKRMADRFPTLREAPSVEWPQDLPSG